MPATPAWPLKSLPRLFVEATLSDGAAVTLDGPQANYLGNVLRLGVGGQVLLFDGTSGEWIATVAQMTRKSMQLTVERRTKAVEAVPDLWLAFAPVKRTQLDWLVEKATELGVARLMPVVTRRTVVERIKGERLRSIAVEAAEQCGRTMLPVIDELVTLERLLNERDPGRMLYFADEIGGEPMVSAFESGPGLILTGPEGGFTPEERELIRAAVGVKPISLGPRILRAETAALAAVAGWMAFAGDWRS